MISFSPKPAMKVFGRALERACCGRQDAGALVVRHIPEFGQHEFLCAAGCLSTGAKCSKTLADEQPVAPGAEVAAVAGLSEAGSSVADVTDVGTPRGNAGWQFSEVTDLGYSTKTLRTGLREASYRRLGRPHG